MSEKIRVMFRMHNVKGETPELIALFPSLPGTRFYLYDCLSYTHHGQHGTCSFNYYYESTRPATPAEYKDLLKELQGIYDGKLILTNRMTRKDAEQRRRAVSKTTPTE